MSNHSCYALEKVLQNIAKDQGLQNYTITKASGTGNGDGYQGIITAIEMLGNGDLDKSVLHLIIKSAPKNDILRERMHISETFQREIYMYKCIIPALQNLAAKTGLSTSTNFVKCYETISAQKSEALILENLKTKDFKMWDRKVLINGEHVVLIMKTLGRLHALSFALKDKEPELFNQLIKPMKEDDVHSAVFGKRDVPEVIEKICYGAAKTLCSNEDAQALKAFENFTSEAFKIAHSHKYVEDYVVILHGDCWINNMMFAYDNTKQPNTPTDMYLIDLQLSRVGHPVIDILYYFYSSCSMDVLSNFELYLDIYYSSLSAHLEALGSNPKKLYPYSVFRQQWQDNVKYGLLQALFLTRLILVEEGDYLLKTAAPDTNLEEMYTGSILREDEYNARVKQLILHFVKNKFI